MEDYYKLLNLSMAKEKGMLTDEMVERNYNAKREQYLKMKKAGTNIKGVNSGELDALNDGDYLQLLEDAYCALKTENSRKHYDELWSSIQANREKNKQNEEKTTVEHKEMAKEKTTNGYQETSKQPRDDFAKVLGLMKEMKNDKPDTAQIIKKIRQEADEKYPLIQENKENKDNMDHGDIE